MTINIVLVHKFKALDNYIFYDKVIEAVIENVSKFNNIKYKGKTCRVFFIGNMHHKNFVEKFGLEFVSLKKYPLNNFLYKTHLSSNSELYESFCFKRHLILWKFLNEYNLNNIIYLDSDVMIFNHKKFLETFYQPKKDIVVHKPGRTIIPCFIYYSKRGLNYVKTAIINFFKMTSVEMLNYLYELQSFYNYKKNRQFSDMYFFSELFSNEKFISDFGSYFKISPLFLNFDSNCEEFIGNFMHTLEENPNSEIVFNKEDKNWYMKNCLIHQNRKDRIGSEYFPVNAIHLAGQGKVLAKHICDLYKKKETIVLQSKDTVEKLESNVMYQG